MNAGLCSVTFRSLSAEEIIALCLKNWLNCIEWGGDVHVPHGNIALAREIGAKTRKNDLKTPSYGSYFKFENDNFEQISLTAEALGAKIIRVWAGTKDAELFSETEFKELVKKVAFCAEIADKRGQIIAFEHHFGTFCNSADNALKLILAADKPNVKSYWQPAYWLGEDSFAADIVAIEKLKAHIECVHVYKWRGIDRLPLSVGENEWRAYKNLLGKNNYYLEFVQNDSLNQFSDDTKTLLNILKKQ